MGKILLSARNVSKLYGADKAKAIKLKQAGADKDTIYQKTGVVTALWDVTLDVKESEVFAIIGLSGSGKSTLVRCFNMLNKPTSGQIFTKTRTLVGFQKKS